MVAFSFRKGVNKELIVERTNKARNCSDGKVSFDAIELNQIEPVLCSAMDVSSGRQVDNHTVRLVINKALFSKKLGCPFTIDQFEKECRKQFHILNKHPKERYYLFGQISLKAFKGKMIKHDDVVIRWNPSTTSKFMKIAIKEREIVLQENSRRLHLVTPQKKLMNVISYVDAVSPFEAYYRSIDAVDEIRGIMNIIYNFPRRWQISIGSPPAPVNLIRNGPLFTIHREDGRLIEDTFWYEANWREPAKYAVVDSTNKSYESFRYILRKLRKEHDLITPARAALLQYCRALDLHEHKESFLGLWSNLEFLTLSEKDSYEKLVHRAASMHEDYVWMKEIGRHLQYRRNAIVHTSSQESDLETLVYQAKFLVEQLLKIYIINPFKLESVSEIIELLDAPKDAQKLLRKKHVITSAERFYTRT